MMRLYAGPSTYFVRETHNQIAAKLTTAFFHHYRRKPSPNEVQSWQSSLGRPLGHAGSCREGP
jgi:hypothetical protein